jgi:hypothetical protein
LQNALETYAKEHPMLANLKNLFTRPAQSMSAFRPQVELLEDRNVLTGITLPGVYAEMAIVSVLESAEQIGICYAPETYRIDSAGKESASLRIRKP